MGREQQKLIQRHIEYVKAAVQLDSTKVAELRAAAMKCVADYNKEHQHIRRTERRFFYDSQTSIIQCSQPNLRKRKILEKEPSEKNSYPVALNQFQFQEYFKRFTSNELRRLPLNTVLDAEHLFPPKREMSPPPVRVTNEDLVRQERALERIADRVKKESSPLPDTPKTARVAPARRSERNPARVCTSCRSADEGEGPLDRLLKCCQCQTYVHARCAEMSLEMVRIVRSYNWCCIDCKTCTICNKPDEEVCD